MELTAEELNRIAASRTIELTTIGRKSGEPRRIEIWWFRVNERFIITGTPGRRGWLANVIANPSIVIHANGSDIEATAKVIEDPDLRREVFTHPDTSWYSTQAERERLVAKSPMIEVSFD